MHTKVLVFGLVLLMQACVPLSAQTLAPEPPDSPGILQRLAEKAREAKAKVQDYGATAVGFFGAYYEDHIQPVSDSYAKWASNVRSSMWEKIQTSIDGYMPFRATNATDLN
ncbi:apolipoprotein C-IV [Hippoglossus hippoglossus]|uniref:apolipoprotein C-IV n=1 Tax=Hippoglossus hippoglossus TaxID=8267 RepID=UPI00148E4465|nr:apolipoprotein C-IV [Hippoglossus hippoglossus]XP_035020118.1 apolipoprotein C-IV [Hippoglossus stenolepis]